MIRKFKINKPLRNKKAGGTIAVKCNDDGIPLDRFWRDRLKDSEIDNCIEPMAITPTKKGDK